MSLNTTELQNDQSGFSEKQLEPFRQEALDSLIDSLFDGDSVGGFHLDAYVEKFAEEIAAWLVCDARNGGMTVSVMRYNLKIMLIRELEGSDALHERAAELAQEE